MRTTITEDATKSGATQPFDAAHFENAEAAGDWGLFLHRCKCIEADPLIETSQSIKLKQRVCLAYLGSRAQAAGGVYMRARPSVFTAAYVERLTADNANKRFGRYPWLERLIDLLQQLDHDQYIGSTEHARLVVNPLLHQRLRLVPNLPA